MPTYNLKDLAAKKPFPGFELKFIHGDNITSAHWQIDEGSLLPEHSHPHEQFSFVLEGKLELIIDGVVNIMEPGKVAVISGNVLHSGKALTDCKVLDVFSPVREDFV
jgi:quercetin dioxygenase-like cupin family protein